MMIPGSFEYAQVRIQSRYAARADASAWREMEHARELSRLIELARHSGFDRVVARLPTPLGLHALDVALREQWHERVDEVAGWMPLDWQAAVQWCSLVVALPFMQYMADGGIPYGWMQGETSFAETRGQPSRRTPAPWGAGQAIAGQHETWAGPETVASGWYRELRRRMPRLSEEEAAHFLVFVGIVESHRGAFSRAAVDDGWRLRHLLEEKLTALFRRSILAPLAAFAFLALQWLELERLRGEIARRLAFPLRGLLP